MDTAGRNRDEDHNSKGPFEKDEHNEIFRKLEQRMNCGLTFDVLCKFLKTNELVSESQLKVIQSTEDVSSGIKIAMATLLDKGNKSIECLHAFIQGLEEESNLQKRLKKVITQLQCSNVPPKLNVVLLGNAGSGKSTTGNTILGKQSFLQVDGPKKFSTTRQGTTNFENVTINVVDESTFPTTELSYPNEVHVFLLLVRRDVRLTKETKSFFTTLRDVLGEPVFDYSLLVITHCPGKISDVLKESGELMDLYHKCSGNIVAVENSDDGLLQEERDKLLSAIIEVVYLNKGKFFKIQNERKNYWPTVRTLFATASAVALGCYFLYNYSPLDIIFHVYSFVAKQLGIDLFKKKLQMPFGP